MTKLRVSYVAASLALLPLTPALAADAVPFYQLQSTLNLGGTGASWDHIDIDPQHQMLYLSRRADGLTAVDAKTGKVAGEVANTKGTGSIAINAKADRGYTANTDGSTTIFKLSDLSTLDRISFGDNFDGVIYDEGTNTLAYQQADNSKELLVDATTMKLVGTIEVKGEQLERPINDGKGFLYLPLRDKNTVYKIDIKGKSIAATWDISAKCVEPSGSEFDTQSNRLLLACRGKQLAPVLAVINADTGEVTTTNQIGRGADDVILDPASKQLFVSSGVDSVITIYKQESADKYTLTEAIHTRPGARVMRVDPATQKIYTMTAEGTYDPTKKTSLAVSPFYANKFVPGTFGLLTYGRGPAK